MKKEIKVGDTVILKSLRKKRYEDMNWIKREKTKPQIGDKFKVQRVGGGGNQQWLDLEGLTLSHPIGKFELI